MKQKILFLFLIIGSLGMLQAQTPLGFQYQAVARDTDGDILSNTAILLRFQFLDGSPSGALTYEETHSLTTNSFGLIQTVIGQGDVETGNFSQLDWAEKTYFLEVELNGQTISTTPFQAVPYAKVATEMEIGDLENVNTPNPEVNHTLVWDGQNWTAAEAPNPDPDPTNELQQIALQNGELVLSDGGGSVDLNAFASPWELDGETVYRTNGRLGLGTMSPQTGLHDATNNGFLFGSNLEGNGSKTFLDPGTGAFRTGIATNSSWDANKLGLYSMASGSGTEASGWFSSANGISTRALSYGSFAIGTYNVGYAGSPFAWGADDPVFEVGVGSSENDRRNALTVWKDGKLSINSTFAVSPSSPIVRIDNLEKAPRSLSIIQEGGNFFGSEGIYIQISNNFIDDPNSGLTTATTGLTASAGGNDGRTTGVIAGAQSFSNKGYDAYGLRANARNNNGTGEAYGIFAEATGSSSGPKYAGYFDGDVFSTGSYLPSDARLKTQVQSAGQALDKILSLAVKTYQYDQHAHPHMKLPEGQRTGFLAQDLAQIVPELVKESVHPGAFPAEGAPTQIDAGKVRFQAVDYAGLVPYLVKAIQEQQSVMDQQEERIKTLEEENRKLHRQTMNHELLESRVSELETLIKNGN